MVRIARTTSGPRLARPRFPTVVDAYLKDVQAGRQAADPMDRHPALQRTLNPYHVKHLRRFFGKRLVTAINSPVIVKYGMQRKASGEAPSIINDELRALDRLLRFAVQRGWLQTVPTIWLVPQPVAAPASSHGPRLELRRRWFGHAPVPSAGSLPSKGKAQRRGYLKRPYGQDGAVPMDTLRKLMADYDRENPGKLKQRLNDAFPGLNASSKAIYTAVEKIRSSAP